MPAQGSKLEGRAVRCACRSAAGRRVRAAGARKRGRGKRPSPRRPPARGPLRAAGGRVGPLATRRAADRGPLAIPARGRAFGQRGQRLAEYSRRRDAAGASAADHAALARWCRKNRLDQQQRAEWCAVLRGTGQPRSDLGAETQTVSRNAYDTRRNRAGQNGDARDRQGRRQLEGGDCPLAGRGGTRRCAIARHRQREGRRAVRPAELVAWSASFGSSGGTRLSARCCWRYCRRWARTRARRRRRRWRGTQCSRLSTTCARPQSPG